MVTEFKPSTSKDRESFVINSRYDYKDAVSF
jgi:hypothetical protein